MPSWDSREPAAERIVFVAGRNPLEEIGGGHSSYVRVHARAAIRAGFEPHIFCVSRRGGVVETDFGAIHRTPSPFRPFRQLMICGHGPLLAAGIQRFVWSRAGPHLIHSFGVWGYAGVLASQRLRRHGVEAVPVVSSYTAYEVESRGKVRGLVPAHGLRGRLRYRAEHLWIRLVVERYERRGYGESSLVMCNYESVRQLLQTKYALGTKCRKLPYTSESAFLGAEADSPSEVPGPLAALRPLDAPVVLSLSRHEPNKGLPVLLQALTKLRASGLAFCACLVGEGSLVARHRRLAADLGLGDIVRITGFVPDPRPYLRHADVFVLPSLNEQSGSLALIEALQVGLPVIASCCDGIPEDVVDGESALLVPPGDAVALAAAIRRLLGDPLLRKRLADAARRTFEARFSAEVFTEALRKTYAELGFEGARG